MRFPRFVIAAPAVVATLGCGGIWGERCTPATFPPACRGDDTLVTCEYDSWAIGSYEVREKRCADLEFCWDGPTGGARCVVGPPDEPCEPESAQRCQGDLLQQCRGEGDDARWSVTEDCSGRDGVCVEAGLDATCAQEPPDWCDAGTDTVRCEGPQAQSCVRIGVAEPARPARWVGVEDCAPGNVCLVTRTRARCVADPPTVCAWSEGHERCVDGRRQRCPAGKGRSPLDERPPPSDPEPTFWVETPVECR